MSWSVNAVGEPSAVKAKMAAAFEQAKRNVQHNEHESKTVAWAEQIVLAELDFCYAQGCPAVTITAGGSCSMAAGTWPGQSQVSIKVDPISGFLK
jgi:hypothetical protein